MPTKLSFEISHFIGQLLEKMRRRSINNRVHGIKPQSIEVIVAQPHKGVVAKKSTHFIAKGSVEVDSCAPWSRVTVVKIWAETVQIVAGGSQVVVNNVENNGQTARVAGVNQMLEIIRLTVSMMRRIKVDAIIAPTAASGKFGNRHQFDMRGAEPGQMIEFFDRRHIASFEITEGLTDGQEIITGGYKAIAKDLDDGKKVSFSGSKK